MSGVRAIGEEMDTVKVTVKMGTTGHVLHPGFAGLRNGKFTKPWLACGCPWSQRAGVAMRIVEAGWENVTCRRHLNRVGRAQSE